MAHETVYVREYFQLPKYSILIFLILYITNIFVHHNKCRHVQDNKFRHFVVEKSYLFFFYKFYCYIFSRRISVNYWTPLTLTKKFRVLWNSLLYLLCEWQVEYTFRDYCNLSTAHLAQVIITICKLFPNRFNFITIL